MSLRPMSLRQKGIEIRFADFIEKYFSYAGFHLSSHLTPWELVRAVSHNQLYERTIKVIEDLSDLYKDKNPTVENPQQICDLIRRYFRLPKLYFFTVNQAQKKVEMTYSFPERSDHTMVFNQAFIKKLADKENQVKCAEAIKSYFRIDFPELVFEFLGSTVGDKGDTRLLFYSPELEHVQEAYSHLLKFIFSIRTSFDIDKVAAPVKKKPIPDKDQFSKKLSVYHRLIANLPAMMGEGQQELGQAARSLLQMAHFTQVVVCDGILNKVFGIYNLDQGDQDSIPKVMPKELKKEFSEAEKKHLARKLKSTSGKYLLIFVSDPLHPQKKSPEMPFSNYADILEKTLIRYSAFQKKK